MSTIASAIDDEKQLEDDKKGKQDAMIKRGQQQAAGTGIEAISQGKGYRYEDDPVKGKR